MSKTVDPEELMREALQSVERISREHKGETGPNADEPAGVEIDTGDVPGTGAADDPPPDSAMVQAMQAQIESMAKDLEAAQAALKEADDKYKRSLADQENFRKRTQKDRLDLIRFGHEKFASEALQVLDNFQRALEHAGNLPEDPAVQQFLTGIQMTATLFQQAFEKYGIKPVPGIGAAFDPAIHQAMQQIERDDVPPSQVVDLYQKGYMIYEKLLRPALVGVSKVPAPQAGAATVAADGDGVSSGNGPDTPSSESSS
ncbi:MAG: nucleotide exchange factor GrpE [Deltaproteobacteria bacterium]|nr:nucleotide exchange factor GrpE [Deltaproteobacteria bacterium]